MENAFGKPFFQLVAQADEIHAGIKDLLAQYARSIFARTPLQRQTCRCGRAYCSVPRLRLLLTLSRAVFRPLQVKKTDHILMVGAGNSRLTEDIWV